MLADFVAALLAVAITLGAIRYAALLGWLAIAVVDYERDPAVAAPAKIAPAVDRYAALRVREAA
jgi:hypothetical protein